MTEKVRDVFRRLAGDGKTRRWLIAAGVIGILLIGLSEWIPGRRRAGASGETGTVLTAAQVEQALEERITAIISRVDGIGECRVMVTLENGVRFVYAADETVSDGGSIASRSILSVQTDTGPVGLPVTEICPTVRGVAVVCAGGDDPGVRERVTSLITAAFNISSRRVSVVK